MTDYMLTGNLADRLLAIAQRKSQTPEELLESLLDAAATASTENSLSALAARLSEAAFESGHTDVAEHSRRILESEFGNHLLGQRRNADDE